MSEMEETEARLRALVNVATEIRDVLLELREDLKRREARRLEETRGFPDRKANGGAAGGDRLPNYGRKAGEPISGAAIEDLEYYASGCRRSLADPGKSRYHATERTRLAAIEAEIARQRGSAPAPSSGPDFGGPGVSDDDCPF